MVSYYGRTLHFSYLPKSRNEKWVSVTCSTFQIVCVLKHERDVTKGTDGMLGLSLAASQLHPLVATFLFLYEQVEGPTMYHCGRMLKLQFANGGLSVCLDQS